MNFANHLINFKLVNETQKCKISIDNYYHEALILLYVAHFIIQTLGSCTIQTTAHGAQITTVILEFNTKTIRGDKVKWFHTRKKKLKLEKGGKTTILTAHLNSC